MGQTNCGNARTWKALALSTWSDYERPCKISTFRLGRVKRNLGLNSFQTYSFQVKRMPLDFKYQAALESIKIHIWILTRSFSDTSIGTHQPEVSHGKWRSRRPQSHWKSSPSPLFNPRGLDCEAQKPRKLFFTVLPTLRRKEQMQMGKWEQPKTRRESLILFSSTFSNGASNENVQFFHTIIYLTVSQERHLNGWFISQKPTSLFSSGLVLTR